MSNVSPVTRYAKSGDVSVAYQVVGDGPPDLVLVPGFVSHVEAAWEWPYLARFLHRLASFARLIVRQTWHRAFRSDDAPTDVRRSDGRHPGRHGRGRMPACA